MTYRDLFLSIMHYGDYDRMPVIHWTAWPEVYRDWYAEGLPRDQPEHQFLGAVPTSAGVSLHVDLFPTFAEETLEETAEYRVFRQGDGVVAKHWKNKSCIPHYIDYTLKDRSGWAIYRELLQPDPKRIPQDFDRHLEAVRQSGLPVGINTGSMIGWTRNWMGVENMAYACYDDRALIAEIADTVADLICWQLDYVCPKIQVDIGWGWEDICFRSGPLISPDIFRETCVPAYRKIAEKLRSYGCDLYLVDCDGMIDDLVPHWLDAGVNVMFPIEIGAWDADPAKFRRMYGKDLRILGGINKLAIPEGPAAIDAEIERRLPLMREGGFIPMPDHLIVPGTSLANYRYYLDRIRELRF